ncbi:estradiol 17-beta-dehydrogenase 2 [Diachasma alloeum]|uniref:estradiol 17-beta-dehydrogenase 2 n=1 Tax=Diachasma alloeum TaxID=454923 RepID=UPI000738449A|nr:estradiol 17-beta-dehydrogenase 2 [Diachasma alloeum]
MKNLLRRNCLSVGFFSSVMCLWKSGSISSPATALLLTSGVACFYLTKRSLRKITHRDTIVLTGCDSGLGYNLALHCHKNLSARVIAGVHGRNSLGAQELVKTGITIQEIDITDAESVEHFVEKVREYLERDNLCLRALVNNAGAMVFGEFEWQTDSQIRHQVEVNLLGTMRLTKSMLPLLRQHKSRLTIVTSHCAQEPLPGVAAYGATKAALAAWATALRIELKKFEVDVVTFIPGSFVMESNILLRQADHFEKMDKAMKEEAKSVYGEYFNEYRNYLRPLSQQNALKRINNERLFEIFEDVIMEEPARSTYKCEPWRYTYYHALLKFVPRRLHDIIVEKFVRMPTWKPPKCKKTTQVLMIS